MGQRKFAFTLKVLEGADGIVQVSKNSSFHLRLDATTHQKKASARESRGNQQHGEQELCPHPKLRHACSPVSLVQIFCSALSARICSPCRVPSGNALDWRDLSPASAATSECDCQRSGWKDNFDIPRLHSATHRVRSHARHSVPGISKS